jgi:hypothetical protein
MRIAPTDRSRANLLALLVAATFAAAGGVIAGRGDITLTVLAAGGAIGVFLLAKPTIALWFVILGGLVLTGLTQLYLPQLQFVRWAFALLAWGLGALAIMRSLVATPGPRSVTLPAIWWWMLAFAGVAALSSALNFSDTGTLLFGLKGHFQIWGVFIAIILMRWSEEVIDQLPRLLVGIALIQLPFVLHQYLVLVPARVHIGGLVVAEDVISGTLGATTTGGGANAVLSLVLIIAAAVLLAKFQRGLISGPRLCSYLLLLMLPIVLNSNRVALLYLVLVYLMLFSGEIFKAPLRAFFVALLFAATLGVVTWSYLKTTSRADPTLDWKSVVTQAVEQNTREDYGYGAYELNRFTSLTFWVKEHRDARWDKILLGHGVAASREADGSGAVISPRTLAQRVYPGVGIGLTTVSAVLWDTGVLGLACWLALLVTAYRAAGRLARHYEAIPARAAALRGFQVAIPILFISFFHKAFLTFHLPYQMLLLLVLGYLGYWQAKAWADDAAPAHGRSYAAAAKPAS